MHADLITRSVLSEVWTERVQQDEQWGQQNHPDGTKESLGRLADACKEKNAHAVRLGRLTWHDILQEEVLEVASEEDPALLRAELIQVAAVAVAWVEAIDRRPA